MSRVKWDQTGERKFETGVDHGMLYVMKDGTYGKGVVWNGLISVNETPSGAEPTDFYADNIKYLSMRSAEELGLTIECYTTPVEFDECDGSVTVGKGATIGQQSRKNFATSYRTKVASDTDQDLGYKLHMVYGCSASPSERSYQTVNDSPEAITFSYEVNTTPVTVGGDFKPTSILTIDSTEANSEKLKQIEDILYGTDPVGEESTEEYVPGTEPRIPLPDEVISILAEG